jgi:hypothetical protein
MNTAPILPCLLLAASASAFAASPCDAPDLFLKPVRAVSAPSPLVRPYVIAGLAALAVREEGDARWLELAVHSADEARRQLAPVAAGATVEIRDARVWLRCPASPPLVSAAGGAR